MRHRGLFILLYFLTGALMMYSQELVAPRDTVLPVIGDTIATAVTDSTVLASDSTQSKQVGLDAPVIYQAKDSMVMTAGNWAYLYGEGDVKYQQIGLQAENIEMSLDSSLVFAKFGLVSIGEEFGYPLFKDGDQEYESKTMRYNFNTKKGYITDVITQQGEGFVTAGRTKKMDDDVLNMVGGKYTTCDEHDHPHFYIQMTKRYGWTKRVLTNFIEAQTYEKYLLNQTNFDLTLTEERRVQAKLAVKDEYTFDFAELSPEYSEHELEMQLVNNIRSFLIEMGGDFTFIGNQYHLMIGSRDLYIDLLLFHRRLRSLIAIELKIGEFEAEYAGKMQMYLTALDEQVKLPDENPSIGIIICKSKDKMYVEYALKQINAPIGVATYQLRNTLPEEMKAMLPEPEEIVKRLRIFEKE